MNAHNQKLRSTSLIVTLNKKNKQTNKNKNKKQKTKNKNKLEFRGSWFTRSLYSQNIQGGPPLVGINWK